MTGVRILLIAHEGHVTLKFFRELFEQGLLPTQMPGVIAAEALVVPVLAQPVARLWASPIASRDGSRSRHCLGPKSVPSWQTRLRRDMGSSRTSAKTLQIHRQFGENCGSPRMDVQVIPKQILLSIEF